MLQDACGTAPLLRYFVRTYHGTCINAYKQVPKLANSRTGVAQRKQLLHRQNEVVKYVAQNFQEHSAIENTSELGVLENDKQDLLHALETNPSQLLGFNKDELEERVDLFRWTGITFNDAISLALVIPPFLDINSTNFTNIIKSLQKYKLPVEKILYNNPHIGGFSHAQVEENLKVLSGVNSTVALEELILQNPIMLSYPLNKTSLILSEHVGKINFVTSAGMPLQNLAVQNEVVAKHFLEGHCDIKSLKDVENFFLDYEVDFERLYRICPEILMSTKEALNKSYESVVSEPFYFEVEDVRKLIGSHPDVFISIHRENVVQQIQYINENVNSKRVMYKLLLKYPKIFLDPGKFFQRVSLYKRFDFTDADIGRLLSVQKSGCLCFMDSYTYRDETITQLLELYNKVGLKPVQIILSSPRCLNAEALPIVEQRLHFLQKIDKVKEIPKMPKLPAKENLSLREIINSSVNEFVQLCGSTVEEFENSS